MKFSCLQENLLKGLQIVGRAVPTKSSLPILGNVLIETKKGRLKLSSTNLETVITTYVNASVDEEGATTIPAKLLKDFVMNLSPDTLKVEEKDEIITLKSKSTKSKFNGSSANDFPALPDFPKKSQSLKIDPTTFDETISLVAFASGTDTSRPIFTGVYLKFSKNKLTVACTDGFRLSEKTLNVKSNLEDFTVVIPTKTLVEVAKIFSVSIEPIEFILNRDENLALFKSEDTMVATRILDGKYPDYKRIIPTDSAVKAEFNSEKFAEAVRLTSVFAQQGNNTIKVRLDPEGSIKVTSLSEETGQHESNLKVEVDGDLIEIAFNAKYLLDFLQNVKADKIKFSTNGNIAPCMFLPEGYKDFIHIIMPMQI